MAVGPALWVLPRHREWEAAMFLGWRVGLQEVLLCGALVFGLIVIPALVCWRRQRIGKGRGEGD